MYNPEDWPHEVQTPEATDDPVIQDPLQSIFDDFGFDDLDLVMKAK